jgi:hypothetical protein
LRVARLPEDAALLDRARELAIAIRREDPDLRSPANALLRDALEARFSALDGDRLAA